MRFADVKSDIAFKRIFGNENKKAILISFLNSVLDLNGNKEIEDIVILSSDQAPKVDELKHTVVDIRAVDRRGIIFIIEIQIQRQTGFEKRVLYYTSKAYVNQLLKGDDYPKLNQVIFIGIVDFEMFEGNNYLTRHLILNTATLNQDLKDFEFNFIELPKFNKKEDDVESVVDKWTYFIKNAPSLQMVPKSADFVEIKEAYEIANTSTWSKEDVDIYNDWLVDLQTYKGIIEYQVNIAVEKALIKGKTEGIVEGRIEGKTEGLVEGKTEGLIEGIEDILEIKYGDKGMELMESVKKLKTIEKLDEFKKLLKSSTTIDELLIYFKRP
ncbi:MAG: Rpn family recombination-promoting nuclease/putative transposase [Nitrospirae bacterium]|nr:Rpn family recombination-promoting nuclease/putative transposase [Nitrospirota bacterium]